MTDPKILDRVLKLFRLSGSDNEHEAELAITRMRSLMAQHAISLAEVEAANARAGLPPRTWDVTHRAAYTRKGVLARYDHAVAQTVALMTDTQCFLDAHYQGSAKYQSMAFIGTPDDVEMASQLFHLLLSQARHYARRMYGSGWSALHTSYALGFGQRLFARAKAWTATTPAVQQSYALVVQQKTDAIATYRETHLKIVNKAYRKVNVRAGAYAQGWHQGGAIDLGGKKIGGAA